MSGIRIIVTGLIAQHPLGGVAWDYIQYVLGLRKLGHDVFYFEDSGNWPYALDGGQGGKNFAVSDCSGNARYLSDLMARFSLSDRWAYRCGIDWEWFGLSEGVRAEILRSADLLINISSTLVRPQEYRHIPRLAFIDSDPVFTQLKLLRGQRDFQAVIDMHDVFFTFGEALPDELLATGHDWKPARQPVILSEWRPGSPARPVFTTVMNWASYNPVVYQNRSFGQKDVEFMRFVELPRKVKSETMEIAARGTSRRELPPALVSHLRYKGWSLVDPAEACPDFDSYRNYIETSKAEWSIAKNGYVVGPSGWFSCRSACYLAAGRPVVVQDTGFSRVLPAGEGVLVFSSLDEAAEAIREVSANYARHSRAARAIAEEYFDSDKVLTALIQQAMSSQTTRTAVLEAS